MSDSKKIIFLLDGNELVAQEGQTIMEAMLSNGIEHTRHTRNDKARSAFCGMGICYECRMVVNGIPNVRACTTPVTTGCMVERQHDGKLEQMEVEV